MSTVALFFGPDRYTIENMIRVTAQFFGPAADLTGCRERAYEFPDSPTLDTLIQRLREDYPILGPAESAIRFAINCEYANADAPLRQGDEIAVIPPVSGG